MKYSLRILLPNSLAVLVVAFLLSWIPVASTAQAQDPHFSQFHATSLYLNPAFAGAASGITLGLNHRSQWRSLATPLTTQHLGLIMPLQRRGPGGGNWGGTGLSIYNDWAGEGSVRTMGVNGSFAYNLPLSRNSAHVITMGLQGGFLQKSIDMSGGGWASQYRPGVGFDPNMSSGEDYVGNAAMVADISAGAMWHYNLQPSLLGEGMGFYLGVSGFHLNQPNESFITGQSTPLQRKFVAHGGLQIPLSDRISLAPSVMAQMQNETLQINGGSYLIIKMADSDNMFTPTFVQGGGWYRHTDAAIAATGLGNKYYTLAFSYDLPVSSEVSSMRARGAWELSLIMRMVKQRKEVAPRRPRFDS
jgi:type IX secretion system PorP/SprF family membrane protein